MTWDSQREPARGPAPGTTSVLFVCLGNICRSPLAEGVLEHLLDEAGRREEWFVDSAGTGAYHVGESADPRTCAVAERHGITLSGVARQFRMDDLRTFDYVIAMDRENLRNIERLARGGEAGAAVHLLREFDPEADGDLEVPDPYYGEGDGFQRVYEMVHRSCVGFLEHVDGR